jgi:replicative DNA helicase
MKQEMLKSILTMGKDNPNIVRGFAYDKKFIKERIEDYENAEKGTNPNLIKFGIKGLDELVGGMMKGQVSLAYAKTGGGKSIFAINIAVNAAAMGHNVMYVSAEMTHDEVAKKIDSRLSFLNSHNIVFGKLSPADKKNYRNKLAEHYQNILSGKRKDVYICDVARGASVPIILSELELYKSTMGIYPDLVVADYANIIDPTVATPEMYVALGKVLKEFKENAKYYKCAFLTLMQESRSATIEQAKAEKKEKKEESTDGVHNIAGSGFAAHHCENVFHLKQDACEFALGKIWLIINKCRHGVGNNKKLALRCSLPKTYIGEDIVAL